MKDSLARTSSVVVALLVVTLVGTPSVRGDDSAALEFFERKVRPLLIAKCQDCHSADSAESELRVDSLSALLKGGTRGPAIVPGKPAESLMLSAMKHGETLKMPPKEKPSREEIAIITQWIEAGAQWPDSGPVAKSVGGAVAKEPEITAEQQDFWAFQPARRTPTPAVTQPDWIRSSLDAFILHKLEAAGLSPAPQADKRTLLRRVTFDLIGLPPTPDEVDAFLADDSADAFEKVVDRLLASPHYGERYGRHWLDVARYADSNGLDENLAHAHAYRYRDYVVRSFNRDLPFDDFLTEQLAGDLLPHGDDAEAVTEGLAATGFLVLGAKMLAEDDPVKMQMDIIDEQIDTVGKAFLGLTLGCARCHDHKFDPVSAADYYGLAGIFKSTRTMENFGVVAKWQERPLATPAQLAERQRRQTLVDAKQTEIQRQVDQENQRLLTDERRKLGEYLLAATLQQWREDLKSSTSSLGQQAAAEMPGLQILEAEDYARGNVLRDTTSYGIGIGVLVNRGETPNFVEYDVEVARAGWYQLEVRYAAAGSRPCTLTINGTVRETNLAGGVTGGWQPDSQKWEVVGFFELRAGQNLIRLEQPQFFPHIDKLLIAPAPEELAALVIPKDGPTVACWPELVQTIRDLIAHPEKDPDAVFKAWRELLAQPRMESLKTLPLLALDYQDRAKQILDRPADADLPPSEAALRKLLQDPKGAFATPATIETHYAPAVASNLQQLRAEKENLQALVPQFPDVMAVSDQQVENVPVHYRGSHLTLGPVVPRRYLRILDDGSSPPPSPSGSGRLELAQWLTSDRQPLTARVIVNRVWQWHFGFGLVRSSDNFGMLGELPSHPELLDHIALDFVEQGWSLKRLHREILRSATYQMGTQTSERALLVDPENRLRWKYARRRLEAEAIRDAVLAVSGQLDGTMTGSLLPTANRAYVTSTANVNPAIYQSTRRSLYLPVVRSALYEVFQAFDFADPSVLSGERQSTTVAPQALFMMNSQLVAEQTLNLADRLLSEPTFDDAGRIRALYRTAYARDPDARETDRAIAFVTAYARKSSDDQAPEARRRGWQSLCRAVLGANEFVFVE